MILSTHSTARLHTHRATLSTAVHPEKTEYTQKLLGAASGTAMYRFNFGITVQSTFIDQEPVVC